MNNISILVEDINVCKSYLYQNNITSNLLNKNSEILYKKRVADKLYKFMDISSNTYVSNKEVTQYILNYVKINDLQRDNKFIILDDILKTLLNIQHDDVVTYLNIQKYIYNLFTV